MNPLITSPPKIKITSNTKNVVTEVLIVRLKVLLRAAFTISCVVPDFLEKYSRTLSNTTTVSFNEYPITVSIAAINA